MLVERLFGADLVVDVLITYAHLDVGEVVMGLGVEIVVGADHGVDVIVSMSFGLVEVVEGDSVVKGVVEWNVELERAFAVC